MDIARKIVDLLRNEGVTIMDAENALERAKYLIKFQRLTKNEVAAPCEGAATEAGDHSSAL